MGMPYPEEFVKRAREIYPDKPELFNAIEHGDDALVRSILYNGGCYYRPDPNEIVRLATSDRVHEIVADAQACIARQGLYGDFTEMHREHYCVKRG